MNVDINNLIYEIGEDQDQQKSKQLDSVDKAFIEIYQ